MLTDVSVNFSPSHIPFTQTIRTFLYKQSPSNVKYTTVQFIINDAMFCMFPHGQSNPPLQLNMALSHFLISHQA